MNSSQSWGVTPHALNEYIKKIVKVFLNNLSSKIPIKKADIVANALGGNSKCFPEAFSAARNMLLEIYGFAVHEIPEIKSSKVFIVTSTLETVSILEYTFKQKSEITLLFLTLSYIFMKGEPVNEESVFRYLKKLKIPLEDTNEYFNYNVSKAITESFVKQLYLKREKIQLVSSNETEFVLSWGFRAHLEFSKKSVLDIVANILQKPTICFFRQHSEVNQTVEQMDVE